MVNRDVVINKVQTIERCLRRIEEEYDQNPENLQSFTKQDAIVLNLLRACEASIDLAMHVISQMQWDVPQTSREAFTILSDKNIINQKLAKRLQGMVGFRNIAVHDYQTLNLTILKEIIEHHLHDFKDYAEIMIRL